MYKTTIRLKDRKSITVFKSISIEPSIWIKLHHNDGNKRAYARCDIAMARDLVKVLNTFIEENS